MSRIRPPATLSGLQLEIMNVVWRRGEASVATVWKDVSSTRKLARNTVQTLLTRLERKGWLRHRERRNAYLYSARVERNATLQKLLSRLVDTAFDGSVEGLVMALVDGRGVSAAEADRIQAMIDAARRGRRPGGAKP